MGKQGGLSWGSVQAKTVRLQRQIGPGLLDKNFVSKRIQVQVNIGTKKFGPIDFGSKIISFLVKIRLVLVEIYHYNETRTNVAWSNVPKTVAN